MSHAPRVVIAASPMERLPATVLEHSIKKHCPEAEIIHTWDRKDRPSRGLIKHGGKDPTNFSFVRFWVPALLGYKDRAIYLDSDMLLLGDISELFEMDMADHWVLRTPDPSVLLIDCSRVFWDVHEMMHLATQDPGFYGRNMHTLGGLPSDRVRQIPGFWNHRDMYEEGTTKLLHYTNMSTQPWPNHLHEKIPDHQHGDLWFQALAETVQSGLLSADELPDTLREKIHAPAQDSA